MATEKFVKLHCGGKKLHQTRKNQGVCSLLLECAETPNHQYNGKQVLFRRRRPASFHWEAAPAFS
ncbi:MAG: hypothetical protein CMJ81_12090 [Planctomycetaceae bacterium]|nr:hypothetical protein [Planctomycetaceae bacterium]